MNILKERETVEIRTVSLCNFLSELIKFLVFALTDKLANQ